MNIACALLGLWCATAPATDASCDPHKLPPFRNALKCVNGEWELDHDRLERMMLGDLRSACRRKYPNWNDAAIEDCVHDRLPPTNPGGLR